MTAKERILDGTDWTYIEDVKNPREILLPSRNLILIALRAEKSRDRISFALFDDLALDFGHGSVIEAHR